MESALFSNQIFREVSGLIAANFETVKSHFEPRASGLVTEKDLDNVSLKIVVNYFYMYNTWKSRYKKEANRDLNFLVEDLDGTNAIDCIWAYFKQRYPENYKNICAALLAVSLERFNEIETARIRFANK